jgi:hypothetical protein
MVYLIFRARSDGWFGACGGVGRIGEEGGFLGTYLYIRR